jgi:hypothetical protein
VALHQSRPTEKTLHAQRRPSLYLLFPMVLNDSLKPTSTPTMASDADIGEREYGEDRRRRPTEVVPPAPLLPPVQFWLPEYPAYNTAHHHTTGGATRSEAAGTSEDCQGGRWHHHHHRDRHASSVSSLSSSGLLDLCLNASTTTAAAAGVPRTWRAMCVHNVHLCFSGNRYTCHASSQCEKIAMRDAISMLIRFGARVIGADSEAGGLGVRWEMWSLSYIGTTTKYNVMGPTDVSGSQTCSGSTT